MTEYQPLLRLQFTFRKESGARFLSHLDLTATLEYAIRRARLPVALSEGFNPRPRFSLAAPLAVGYTGERELLEMTMRTTVLPNEALHRLQAALPTGLVLTECVELEPETKSAASRVSGAWYLITLPDDADGLQSRADTVLGLAHIEQDEERDNATRRRDIRPFLRAIEVIDSHTLRLCLGMSNAGSVRPETVLDLLEVSRDGARIIRQQLELD